MQFLSIVSTVINDGEAFISGNEPETFVGAAETAGSVASDFLDKFMNMDFIKEIFTTLQVPDGQLDLFLRILEEYLSSAMPTHM